MALWEIRTYSTDKFHGSRHKADCKENPYATPSLMRRIAGLNTSVAEQTFSWSRGYARSTHELRQARRRFRVPLYAKFHNALLASGETSRLNPYSYQGGRRRKRRMSATTTAPGRRRLSAGKLRGDSIGAISALGIPLNCARPPAHSANPLYAPFTVG